MTNLIDQIIAVNQLTRLWGEMPDYSLPKKIAEEWSRVNSLALELAKADPTNHPIGIQGIESMPFYNSTKHQTYTGFARLQIGNDLPVITYFQNGKLSFLKDTFQINRTSTGKRPLPLYDPFIHSSYTGFVLVKDAYGGKFLKQNLINGKQKRHHGPTPIIEISECQLEQLLTKNPDDTTSSKDLEVIDTRFDSNIFFRNTTFDPNVEVFAFFNGRESLELYVCNEENFLFRRGEYIFSNGTKTLSVDLRQFNKRHKAHSLTITQKPNEVIYYGKNLENERFPKTMSWNSFFSRSTPLKTGTSLSELVILFEEDNTLLDQFQDYQLTDERIPKGSLLYQTKLIHEQPSEDYVFQDQIDGISQLE